MGRVLKLFSKNVYFPTPLQKIYSDSRFVHTIGNEPCARTKHVETSYERSTTRISPRHSLPTHAHITPYIAAAAALVATAMYKYCIVRAPGGGDGRQEHLSSTFDRPTDQMLKT